MRALRAFTKNILCVNVICIGLALSCTLGASVTSEAFAATSLSKKQQQVQAHKRKKAGRLSKARKSTRSKIERRGVKKSAKRRSSACRGRLARAAASSRCVYKPTKAISAFR